jgi:hypothetical protein
MSKKPRDRNEGKARTVAEFCPKCSTPVEAPAERKEVTLKCPTCFVTWTVTTHGR